MQDLVRFSDIAEVMGKDVIKAYTAERSEESRPRAQLGVELPAALPSKDKQLVKNVEQQLKEKDEYFAVLRSQE